MTLRFPWLRKKTRVHIVNESELLHSYLLVGGLLFAVGLVGFLIRRNMIVMFLSVEMMLQGVALSLVAWSRFHQDWGGQILVLFMIAIAACEAAIALALILMLFQRCATLDIVFWQDLREEGQPAFVDRNVPEAPVADPVWPRLTPSGVAPEVDDEEQLYRSRV
jgi:NADH-quinone oxidoreductase subunit K